MGKETYYEHRHTRERAADTRVTGPRVSIIQDTARTRTHVHAYTYTYTDTDTDTDTDTSFEQAAKGLDTHQRPLFRV
jgi:hypothetical protein